MSRLKVVSIAVVVATALLAGVVAIAAWSLRYVPPQHRRPPAPLAAVPPVPDDVSWSSIGADPGQTRHSALAQIRRDNVGHLRQAWVYRTGEPARRGARGRFGKFQATPIIAAGHLVFCTGFGRVIALDPASGQERWVHEPEVPLGGRLPGERYTCRGLARWSSGSADAERPACAERLFVATTDRRLIALDAADGSPCLDFGDRGTVRVPLDRPDLDESELQFTSAPAIVGDTLVVGSASGDNNRARGPDGTVRAFDVRTGSPRWTFDPVPRPTGQANVWGSITVDPARDLVFLPTSSPSPDFYGGLRPGDNRYANSVVAVRGSTGEVVWHFQTVHHDLWDYDVPAGPSLVDFRRPAPDGRIAPALVFATKSGFLFVLDRETGAPLTAVEERPVPPSDVPGEQASPTQPFSTGQPVLAPQKVTSDEAFGVMVWDRYACRRALASASRSEGLFTPPSLGGGTLLVPFSGGGANWGGVAVAPAGRRIFVNTSRAVHRITLFPAEELAARRAAAAGREIAPMRGAPYGVQRELVASPLGLPCNPPPWGALAAVDVETGQLAWEVPLGNTRRLAPLGLALPFGTPNFGGPIHTDGGLVFIAAAMDDLLRAFDADTGEELWAGELPFGGQATPMTYAIGGRQFVVVAAGGHPSLGNAIGDALVAFALPVR